MPPPTKEHPSETSHCQLTVLFHTHTHTHATTITVGEYLRLMQIGTDLTKVKKSKRYERVYHLDEDLLGFSWNSRSKRVAKARSEGWLFRDSAVEWHVWLLSAVSG